MNAVSFTTKPLQKARTLDPNFQLPNRRTISGWHLGTFSEVLPALYSLVFTVPAWVIFPDFFFVVVVLLGFAQIWLLTRNSASWLRLAQCFFS